MGKWLLTATVLVVMVSHGAYGQVSLTRFRAPFLTSDQLRAVVGSDVAAAAIVSEALTYYLGVFPDKTTTVIGAQIPENWLPTIAGVRFIRLPDDAARAHLQQCGRLLFVARFNLASDLATIAIGEGNQCQSGGIDLRFRHSGDTWLLETDGLNGGFGGGISHCPCN